MNRNLNTALRIAIVMTGKSQGRIGKLARLTAPQISQIVQGRVGATPDQRRRLAKVLGKTEAELFGGAL